MRAIIKTGADLKREDNLAGFLSVDIEQSDANTIQTTQTGLIAWIVSVICLEDANPKSTLAKLGTLPKDKREMVAMGDSTIQELLLHL